MTAKHMISQRSCAPQFFSYSSSEVKLEAAKVRSYLVCPECGFPMVLFTSKEARYRSGEPRKYYRCANMKACDIVCGAHPDGTPLGIPGTEETRSARDELHKVFDPLWRTGRWSRPEAYIILQILTDLGEDEAHIACFNKEQCEQVMGQVQEFLRLNPLEDQTQNRAVYLKRECVEHGWGIHRIYLESRQEFCVGCLNQKKGPIWWAFLAFNRGRSSR